MDQATLAILGTTLTAIVTVVGWSVSHVLTARREAQAKQREVTIKYVESQISDLYGPLLSLTQQIFNAWRIRERILGDASLTDNRRLQVRSFFYDNYFKVTHARMREILTSKLYLVEGEIPQSFLQYMEHSNQQLVRGQLQTRLGIATPEVEYVPWPSSFYEDVHGMFLKLQKHLGTVRELA